MCNNGCDGQQADRRQRLNRCGVFGLEGRASHSRAELTFRDPSARLRKGQRDLRQTQTHRAASKLPEARKKLDAMLYNRTSRYRKVSAEPTHAPPPSTLPHGSPPSPNNRDGGAVETLRVVGATVKRPHRASATWTPPEHRYVLSHPPWGVWRSSYRTFRAACALLHPQAGPARATHRLPAPSPSLNS